MSVKVPNGHADCRGKLLHVRVPVPAKVRSASELPYLGTIKCFCTDDRSPCRRVDSVE